MCGAEAQWSDRDSPRGIAGKSLPAWRHSFAHRDKGGSAFCEGPRALGFPLRKACVTRLEAPASGGGALDGPSGIGCRNEADAVDRAGRHAQPAPGAQGFDHRVHLLGRPDDRIHRAGVDAQGAADAARFVDERRLQRLFFAAAGIQSGRLPPE